VFRRTNEESSHAGIYHSDCKCRVEIKVRRGDRFPVCMKCKKVVGWNFTRSVFADPPKPFPAPPAK